jgi:uncharacterized RDD family membrane protein YckC
MLTDNERQFCFPKPHDTGRFFFLVSINPQIYTRSKIIQIYSNLTMWIKRLGKAEIVHQFRKAVRHFIRIRCRFILINFPLLNILLDELTFTHKNSTFIDKYKNKKSSTAEDSLNLLRSTMLTVKLDTGFNIEIDFPISPFHRRMFAYFIDLMVMYFYWKLMQFVFGTQLEKENSPIAWLSVLIGIPVLLYYPLLEILTNGQTIGKIIMGIRVITLEGGQASISQYLIRWMFRTIDFPVWIFFAIWKGAVPWYSSILAFTGIASVILSNKSQRIGDIVAGTIVIFTRSKTTWQETVFTEIEDGYKPRYPQVMKMSDKDINSLKMIIDTVKKNRNHELAFRIAERIKWKLEMQGDQDAQDFLETLLKDYNFYTSR